MGVPEITPEDVQAFAPEAPRVTLTHGQDAADWLAYLFEVRRVDPDSFNERQQRDLKRAACAYALHVAAGGTGRAGRVNSGTAKQIKSVDVVGEVKTEFQSSTAEQAAASASTAADDWLRDAYRYLRRAGLSLPVVVAGARR